MLNRHYLCREEEETNDHLLLFCKGLILWNLVLPLFGLQWVLNSSLVKRNFLSYHGVFVARERRRLEGLPFYA